MMKNERERESLSLSLHTLHAAPVVVSFLNRRILLSLQMRSRARARSPEPEPQAMIRVADARVFAALLGSIRAPTRPQVWVCGERGKRGKRRRAIERFSLRPLRPQTLFL